VLWNAGQARQARQSRDHLTELYVGVRDGYVAGNATLSRVRFKGGYRAPGYVRRAEAQEPVMRSPAERDRELAKLGAMFPGMVRRGDS
jgi:hypothetical protein